MQHVFLGFRLRMGRLAFLLSLFGTSVVTLTFVLGIFKLISEFAGGGNRASLSMGVLVILVPLITVVLCNICGMRARDIGWDPTVVVPLWVLLTLIDYMVSVLVPELAVPNKPLGTWIGRILEAVFLLVLVLHPSKPGGFVDPRDEDEDAEESRPGIPRHLRPIVVPPSRFDRVAPRTSFGRLSQ